ncbi:MAG: hypothetical protein HOJ60_06585 [Euryarchaeota archaeon]|jgi:hypothetical protein|nr:hypothetical protein [Euryarchaeota archaeon]
MARRKYTSKSSKKPYRRRKTSTAPRRAVKKAKTVKKFTAKQLKQYVAMVREHRGESSDESE